MEQTVIIVGCQISAQNILISALKRAGINAKGAAYDTTFTNSTVPQGIIVYLESGEARQARQFLNQPELTYSRKILVIDPRDLSARQLSASIDIDEVIFKPIRIKELTSRLKLILARDSSDQNPEASFCDELDFAQKLQKLSDNEFTGVLCLKGHHSEAEIFFNQGLIKGIRVGQKIQKNAIDAIWRIFPARHRIIANKEFPEWVSDYPVTYDIPTLVTQVVKAGTYFDDEFSDIQGLQSILVVNHEQFELNKSMLPRQVRQITQYFDGRKTLEEIFNLINIDEHLLMQIIRRLLDESFIEEGTFRHHQDDISLAEWIQSTEQACVKSSVNDVLASPDILEFEDEPTPSFTSFAEHDTVITAMAGYQQPAEENDAPLEKTEKISLVDLENRRTQPRSPISIENHSLKKRISIRKSPAVPEDQEGSKPESNQPPQKESTAQKEQETPKTDKKAPNTTANTTMCEGSPFEYEAPELKHYSREEVEEHLKKLKRPMVFGETAIRKQHLYSDAMLAEEAKRDEENEARLQAEDEALLNLTIDDKAIREAGHRDSNTGSLVTPTLARKMPQEEAGSLATPTIARNVPVQIEDISVDRLIPDEDFSPVELYKKNHSQELSPEEWRSSTLTRLKKEDQERQKKLIRILLIISGFVVIALLVVVYLFIIKPEMDGKPVQNQEMQVSEQAETAPAAQDEQPESTVDAPVPEPLAVPSSESEPTPSEAEPAPEAEAIPAVPETESEFDFAGQDSAEPDQQAKTADETAPSEHRSRRHRSDKAEQQEPQSQETANAANDVKADEESQKAEDAKAAEPPKTAESNKGQDSPKPAESPKVDDSAKADTPAKSESTTTRQSRKSAEPEKKINVQEQLKAVREALNRKDLDTAQTLLTPILEQNPNNSSVLTVAVQYSTLKGDFSKALEYLKTLESSQKDKASYWKQRAKIHKSLGQMNESDECIDKAIAILGEDSDEAQALRKTKFNP